MGKNFAIGIPTVNRFDLLKPALLYYAIDFPNTKIFVLDNGKQEITLDLSVIRNKNVNILEYEHNLGVAASWNILCDEIFKEHDFALILNDDIYLGSDEGMVQAAVNFAETQSQKNTFFSSMLENNRPNFVAFLLSKEVYTTVGKFDEEFYPAYYEDDDYIVRMHHANINFMPLNMLRPKVERNTSSISGVKDGHSLVENNRLRFLAKWGSNDPYQAYQTPFNLHL